MTVSKVENVSVMLSLELETNLREVCTLYILWVNTYIAVTILYFISYDLLSICSKLLFA